MSNKAHFGGCRRWSFDSLRIRLELFRLLGQRCGVLTDQLQDHVSKALKYNERMFKTRPKLRSQIWLIFFLPFRFLRQLLLVENLQDWVSSVIKYR